MLNLVERYFFGTDRILFLVRNSIDLRNNASLPQIFIDALRAQTRILYSTAKHLAGFDDMAAVHAAKNEA